MVSLFLTILGICLLTWLFWWAIGALGVPDPIGRFARVAIMVIGCLAAIYLLFGYSNSGGVHSIGITTTGDRRSH